MSPPRDAAPPVPADQPTGSPESTSGAVIPVTVGILTFRRPDELALTLDAVLAHLDSEMPDGFSVEVLVVDNDAAGSAEDEVTGRADARIRYLVEPSPGIVAARNRVLDETTASRLLIFLDDDNRPGEHWLTPLLTTWQTYRPAAVCGRMRVEYSTPDPFFAAGGFFVRRSMPTGTPIAVAGTGALLLDLDVVRRRSLRFDPGFSSTGGEDTLFTRTLTDSGERMVWCQEAEVIDPVPPNRVTRRWVLDRARSHGNSHGLVTIATARPGRQLLARASLLVSGVGRMAAGAGRTVLGLASRSMTHQARGRRLIARGRGMAGSALGTVVHEYQRSDTTR